MENEAQASLDQNVSEENAMSPEGVFRPTLDALEKIGKSVDKLANIYSLMIEQRDKADLMLTRLTEIVNRISLLEDDLHDESIDRSVLCTRMAALSTKAEKVINSFGVVSIRPNHGDEFNAEQHLIIGEIDPKNEEDRPGTIYTCERAGYIRNGCVTAAEVIVFKEADKNETSSGTDKDSVEGCVADINKTDCDNDGRENLVHISDDIEKVFSLRQFKKEDKCSFFKYICRYFPIVLIAIFSELILCLQFVNWPWLLILITIVGIGFLPGYGDDEKSRIEEDETITDDRLLFWGRYSGLLLLLLPWLSKLGVLSYWLVAFLITISSAIIVVLNYTWDVRLKNRRYSRWYLYVAILLISIIPLIKMTTNVEVLTGSLKKVNGHESLKRCEMESPISTNSVDASKIFTKTDSNNKKEQSK